MIKLGRRDRFSGWEVDGTDSGLCRIEGFSNGNITSFDPAIRVLISIILNEVKFWHPTFTRTPVYRWEPG
jgi:hypothetical protein